MPSTYQVTVNTPCQGTQTVDRNDDENYSGSSGDFAFVSLAYDGSTWQLTIYDYRSGSNCYGSSSYAQVTPDSDPTAGQYGKLDANNQPDTSLGTASVS